MSDFLFKEFDAVSAKQWKQKIQFDLKGADYNDTLVWQSLEGIHVKPFYHADDHLAMYQRKLHPNTWNIAQQLFIDDEEIANNLAKQALDKGAEALILSAEQPFSISTVFRGISIKNTRIYFDFSFLSTGFLKELSEFFKGKSAVVFYGMDSIGQLSRTGNWFESQEKDFEHLSNGLHILSQQNGLCINGALYQNAGANMLQQLAYSLAHANEYLNRFAAQHKDIRVTFKMAVGSNYFFEIAKLRALRLLYASLAKEYGVPEDCHILVLPTKRNKTIYDYNVNMLRTTTESMSAILGGADTICNLPYDAIYHKSNAFGERIARNQLLILKEESYFNTVSNPADGSYYIEALTQELAQKGLQLFKEIEHSGGLLAQLESGTIQKKIKESAQKEQDLFDKKVLTLIGTNKYQNDNDRMKNEIELYPFLKIKPRKTIIEPIIQKRIAASLEKKRIENE